MAQGLVKHESRFKIRPSQGVLDPAHASAQVQPFGAFFGSRKKPLQPSSQIGCLADVRLGAAIFPAQKEHCRNGGYGGEDLGVSFRTELDALTLHLPIVDEGRR